MNIIKDLILTVKGSNGIFHSEPDKDASVSATFKDAHGVTACYVDGFCKGGFDFESGISLKYLQQDTNVEYLAVHLYSPFWCKPAFGNIFSDIPKRTQQLIIKKDDIYHCYTPVCADTYRTFIRGCEGGLEFYTSTNCDYISECNNQLAFVYAAGNDPFEVAHRSAYAITKLLNNGLKLRDQRRMPEVFEYLGWCSWDAMHIHVNHKGLVEKAREFHDKNIPVHYAIIDDMWADCPELLDIPEDDHGGFEGSVMHKIMGTAKMRSFNPCPVRFPQGMEACINDMKAAGIPHVGIWFPITGYWGGLHQNGEAAYQHKNETFIAHTRLGINMLSPDLKSAFSVLDDFCSRIRSWGGEFVKIDDQGIHDPHFKNVAPIGHTGRQLQAAIDSTTGSNFDGALINCMCMPSECLFNRRNSAITRCSDDFQPESRDWFYHNVTQCSYNGLLQGQFYVNDWDMWWTDDEQAVKNSLCRALSGGPVYVSDKIGRSRPDIIKPVVFKDGRLPRCDESCTPTEDCLMADPKTSGKPFKIKNRVGSSGLVALYNIDGDNNAVKGTVSPKDAGLCNGKYVYYEYFSQTAGVMSWEEVIDITLIDNDEMKLYTFVPVDESGITVLGRTDLFVGIKAVVSRRKNTVQLYEGGTIGFVATKPVNVYDDNGNPLQITQNGILSIVECDAENKFIEFEDAE